MDCAKSALNSTLDSLLQLVDSLMLAQLLGLVLALRKQSDSQLFFHLQQRQDFVLSQAVTVVCTALLASIERLSVESLTAWDSVPPLFTFFSFLSCTFHAACFSVKMAYLGHGDERGMIEDMNEIWTTFPGRVMFRFMAASSSVSASEDAMKRLSFLGVTNVRAPFDRDADAGTSHNSLAPLRTREAATEASRRRMVPRADRLLEYR